MKATANKVPVETGSPLTPVSDGASGSNLDQLRDIIFGGQMREYEKRFARMEERLAKEIAELREEVRQRSATLERYARDELQSATERITATNELASKQHRELRAQLRLSFTAATCAEIEDGDRKTKFGGDARVLFDAHRLRRI